MQLMSEVGAQRTYLGADNETWYEVRQEVRGQQYPVVEADWAAYDSDPEAHDRVRAVITRCENSLRAWFMDHVEFDPAGEMTQSFSTATYTREGLARFKHDPNDFLPNVLYRLIFVEQRYWPPAPVDPTPDPQLPKPRINDFRGDHRA